MADNATITAKVRLDSGQMKPDGDKAVSIAQQTGQKIQDVNKQTSASAGLAQQIYKDEVRLLGLVSKGHHAIANDLKEELSLKRSALKIARELKVSEMEGITLARQRIALEKQAAAASAPQALPGMNRVQMSGTKIDPNRPKSMAEYQKQMKVGGAAGAGRNKGYDAQNAYYVLQDLVQGGPAAVANQAPQILSLLKGYGKAIAGGVTALLAVGAGVAAGYAIADWDGFRRAVGGYITGTNAEVALINERTELERVRLKEYKKNLALQRGEEIGTAQGGNAQNRALAEQQGAESRDVGRSESAQGRERQMELIRLRLETIQDEEKRAREIRDHDKEWLLEKAARTKSIADGELEIAMRNRASAKAELNALNDAEKKIKLAAGATGNSKEERRIKAARGGIEARMSSADQALNSASAASRAAGAGVQDATAQAAIIDQRYENEKLELQKRIRETRAEAEIQEEKKAATKAAAEALRVAKKRADDFFHSVGRRINEGFDALDKIQKLKENQTLNQADAKSLQIMELRARGQNKKADRLEKEQSIKTRTDELSKRMDPKAARDLAEREYDAKDPTRAGRIRGVGYRGAAEPAAGGLDGLAMLQTKNHKIRGVGFKGEPPSAMETVGGAVIGAAMGSPGGAALGQVVVAFLTSINAKLEGMQPVKQTRSR